MAQFQHHIWPSWQCWHPPSPCSRRQHATPSLSNTHTPNLELPLALSCQQPYQNQYKLSCQNFRFNDLVLVWWLAVAARPEDAVASGMSPTDNTALISSRESGSPAYQRIPENINHKLGPQQSPELTLYPMDFTSAKLLYLHNM